MVCKLWTLDKCYLCKYVVTCGPLDIVIVALVAVEVIVFNWKFMVVRKGYRGLVEMAAKGLLLLEAPADTSF